MLPRDRSRIVCHPISKAALVNLNRLISERPSRLGAIGDPPGTSREFGWHFIRPGLSGQGWNSRPLQAWKAIQGLQEDVDYLIVAKDARGRHLGTHGDMVDAIAHL